MALQRKVTDEDLEFLMVLSDPIFLTEFLNNTNYGDPNKNNWRRGEPFKLRPYQKEIITDASKNIVVTGGRSIGKCQPDNARIFTTQGYKTIKELKDKSFFTVYGVSRENELRQRRAVITPDERKPIYQIKTAGGHIIQGTDVHPLLTRGGYRLMDNLRIGDQLAVIKKLPTEHCIEQSFDWHEMRIIGYGLFNPSGFSAELLQRPRFDVIEEEFKFLAKKFYCRLIRKKEMNVYMFLRSRGLFLHPVNYLKNQIGLTTAIIPAAFNLEFIKSQSTGLIKAFIEAAFAQHAELARNRITLNAITENMARDMQELLLYFGVESRVENTDLFIENQTAAFLFWSEFELPGVAVHDLKIPPVNYDSINEFLRWDDIIDIQILGNKQTYAVHVYTDETYISDNVVNHNSVILENMLIYQIVNAPNLFRETYEQLLATPNQNQLTPLLDKIINRFAASPLLKDFIVARNLSKGTFDFKATDGKTHRMYARIAGSKDENNIVGLHIEKIAVDEAQLFSQGNFHQLGPTLNQWIPTAQQIYSGVNV